MQLKLVFSILLFLPCYSVFADNTCPLGRPLSCDFPGEMKDCESEPGVLSLPEPDCFCPSGYKLKHDSHLFDGGAETWTCVSRDPSSSISSPAPAVQATETPKATPTAKLPLQQSDWNDCVGNYDSRLVDTQSACYKIAMDRNTNPSDIAMAFGLLGDAYRQGAKYNDAIEMANHAININPNLSLPYLVRGESSFQLDRYQSAIDDFNRALKNYTKPTNTSVQKPSLERYYQDRALAYQFLQKKSEAADDYRRTLALNPGSSYSKEHLDDLQEDQPPQVPDTCIHLGRPIPAGNGCAPGKQWYWTDASINRGAVCPSDLLIEYLNPETSQFEEMSIPARLQTCGSGVTTARSKQ